MESIVHPRIANLVPGDIGRMGRVSVAILDELRSHCLRRPPPERNTNTLFSTL